MLGHYASTYKTIFIGLYIKYAFRQSFHYKEAKTMFSFGLGKKRTKVGKFIDRNGISQGELAEWSGLGRSTVMRICNDTDHAPYEVTIMKIVSALRKRGYSVTVDDLI